MIRRTFWVASGIGLLAVVLFGRDATSYLSTSYRQLTGAVKESVPVEFQIDRARNMVEDLSPEIRNAMHIIAKEEVELEKLNKRVASCEAKASKDQNEILRLQADLQSGGTKFRYAGRSYSADQVRQDLSRRFNRFKVADDTLASLTKMRDAREKNLDASRQKLAAMINARRQLDVDIANLEAKRKLVEVAQATSDYKFDDSQLARTKELISDIRTRLDVQAKLANADVDVDTEIILNESTPEDITNQVADYFKLNVPKETDIAVVSISMEN